MDSFLKEAISILMKEAGAELGAVYLFDEFSRTLVLRVGFDYGDFWDEGRFAREKSLRFSLDDSVPGEAFRDNSIRIVQLEEGIPTGDKLLRSKIIVPIVRGPEKLGVLMMAHEAEDGFNQDDRIELRRAASLLGDILAEAMAMLLPAAEAASMAVPPSRIIRGIKASGGWPLERLCLFGRISTPPPTPLSPAVLPTTNCSVLNGL